MVRNVENQDIHALFLWNSMTVRDIAFVLFVNKYTVLEIERILRDINYQATWMMYGDDLTDASFQDFVRQGYWEIGCHGYRCSYINEGTVWSNHFLMDYIRDRFGASVETESAMRERITQEYERMKHCFMKELGEVPRVYALLHSNTGQYGSQISVSDCNLYCIQSIYAINFNRVGRCRNRKNENCYNLTRMSIQSDWSTEELMYMIEKDGQGR